MLELLISVFAILLILYLGRWGADFGLFHELTTMLALAGAMMVTLRYWWPATAFVMAQVPVASAYAALLAYWVLFLATGLPLYALAEAAAQLSKPHYPPSLNKLLGFIFGTIAAAILVCCALLSASVAVPAFYKPYERAGLLMPLDELPLNVYRTVENRWLNIAPTDPTHTRFPTLEKRDLEDFSKYWR